MIFAKMRILIISITILVNKKLYNDYKHPFKPVGELAAFQGLTVVGVNKDRSPLQSMRERMTHTI
jgi:hypothetical protein